MIKCHKSDQGYIQLPGYEKAKGRTAKNSSTIQWRDWKIYCSTRMNVTTVGSDIEPDRKAESEVIFHEIVDVRGEQTGAIGIGMLEAELEDTNEVAIMQALVECHLRIVPRINIKRKEKRIKDKIIGENGTEKDKHKQNFGDLDDKSVTDRAILYENFKTEISKN